MRDITKETTEISASQSNDWYYMRDAWGLQFMFAAVAYHVGSDPMIITRPIPDYDGMERGLHVGVNFMPSGFSIAYGHVDAMMERIAEWYDDQFSQIEDAEEHLASSDNPPF